MKLAVLFLMTLNSFTFAQEINANNNQTSIVGFQNKKTEEKIILECHEGKMNVDCKSYNFILINKDGTEIKLNKNPILAERLNNKKIVGKQARNSDTLYLWKYNGLSEDLADHASDTTYVDPYIILLGPFALVWLAGQFTYVGLVYTASGIVFLGESAINIATIPIRLVKRSLDKNNANKILHGIQKGKFLQVHNRGFDNFKNYIQRVLDNPTCEQLKKMTPMELFKLGSERIALCKIGNSHTYGHYDLYFRSQSYGEYVPNAAECEKIYKNAYDIGACSSGLALAKAYCEHKCY